jgi:sugar lactone lactonase YvrE
MAGYAISLRDTLYFPKEADMRAAGVLFFAPMIALLGITVSHTAIAAEATHTPEVVATIPSPAFTENISEDADGTIYVTGMLESNLWKISPDGEVEKLAHVEPYSSILGVAAVEEGIVVGAFRRDFRTPNGFDFSNAGPEILLLDKTTGEIMAAVPGQNGQLFNGMVADERGNALVVDSLSASVWQFDPKARTLSLWLRDEELASSKPGARSANGVKVSGDHVYIANSEKRSIYRVGIDADGERQGPLTLFAKDLPHVDDFAVASDGTIFLPPTGQTNPGPLYRVPPGGAASTHAIGPSGASALVSHDDKWVYWPSNSGIDPKTSDPQKLLRVPTR